MTATLLATLADLRPWPLAALAHKLQRDAADVHAQLIALQGSGRVPLQ